MSALLAPLAIALAVVLALAYLLWRGAQGGQRLTGMRAREVVYQDTADREASRPLYAARYGLAGKPDYILRRREGLIPVEVKPGRRAHSPFQADVMQLAAYCLLVEESSGQAPPYGLLRYQEHTFQIRYTAELRRTLLATLEAMRRDGEARTVRRSHHDPERCRHCGQQANCDQSLAD